MLENLTDRLQSVIKTIRGQARFTEQNISDAMREVRIALIEADVALAVVKDFIDRVKTKALGVEVLQSLSPGQAIIKIVQDELTILMGDQNVSLDLNVAPPAIILMAGLQGSGKTTTSAKLAKLLIEKKKKVLLASADVYRPAAIDQLKTLAKSLNIECFDSNPSQKPIKIASETIDYAKKHFFDVVMQGQDAVNTAKAFGDALPLTGVILTKLDSDTRGGAALSVRQVTGKPIKYIGTSEKINGLEPFHPERMASRILGMGDIVSLVEDAQKTLDVKEAEKLAEKVKSGKNFDLEDFKNQIGQMKKMGGVGALMDKMPAQFTSAASKINPEDGDKSLRQIEAIISSMTPLERRKPELIKATRKKRIALGSGVQVQDVNRVLNQFEEMQKMMKMFSKGGLGKLMRGMAGKIPGLRP